VSLESLIIYIAGLILLTELGLKRLINIAKLLRELHNAFKGGPPSPPPRLLDQSDSKGELGSGGP